MELTDAIHLLFDGPDHRSDPIGKHDSIGNSSRRISECGKAYGVGGEILFSGLSDWLNVVNL